MFFLFSLFILALLVPLVFIGDISSAENLTNVLWISLFLGSIFGILKQIDKSIIRYKSIHNSESLSFFRNNYKYLLFLCVVITLFASSLSKKYYLGGDDTRLFYLYPDEYISNFVAKVSSDNSLSGLLNFLPSNSILSFVYLLSVIKEILFFANLQSFMYSLNLILGSYFMYKLLKYLLPKNEHLGRISALGAFSYVFSIFNYYVLFNSKLISIYVLSIFPLFVYLYIRSIREKKLYLIPVIAIVTSVFCIYSVSSFWFFASVIPIIPLFIYQFWDYKLRFLSYTLILGILVVALNIYWIIYLPFTTLFRSDGGAAENSLKSSNFIDENIVGIRSTAEINSLFYPFVNLFHKNIQANFQWSYYSIFESWHLRIIQLNILLPILLVFAGIKARSGKQEFVTYIVFSTCFVLAMFFFTVNIIDFGEFKPGIDVFIYLSKHIPGFLIFRNFFDKFAHSMSFVWAMMLSISLVIVSNNVPKKLFNLIFITVLAITLLNAKPFILNEYNEINIWRTQNSYLGIKNIDPSYLEMTEYIKSQPFTGRYLQIPFGRGNVVTISDSNSENKYYVGVSPLLILTGINDYSGLLSVGGFSDELTDAIISNDYDKAGQIFKKLNVSFLILNKNVSEDLLNSYLYSDGFQNTAKKEFTDALIGDKVADFDPNYVIYEIKPEYKSEKVYIDENSDKLEMSYQKINSQEYAVQIKNIIGIQKLIFLDPYFDEWNIYSQDGSEIFFEQREEFGYANSWMISDEEIKASLNPDQYILNGDGSLNLNLKIYFKPYDYYSKTLNISKFAYLISVLLVIFLYLKYKREK